MIEYTVHKLAALSGVSERTLRYYDRIGLLAPARIEENGYRVYTAREVDTLQQILLYRELGMPLKTIAEALHAPEFDRKNALLMHREALAARRKLLDTLIQNVEKTIRTLEGETMMQDKEKFEGFKKALIEENEKQYGAEIRKQYGDEAVDASVFKMKGMDEGAWQKAEGLRAGINEALKAAMQTGDPAGELSHKLCDMHKDWLCLFWKDGAYSKAAHRGMGEMYVADERFRKYYDGACGEGAAAFLRDALNEYTK